MPLSSTGKLTFTVVLSPPGIEPTANDKDNIMHSLLVALNANIKTGVEYIQVEYETMQVM